MNWIDKVIDAVSPSVGYQRKLARKRSAALDQLARYEGASQKKRLEFWNVSRGVSPDQEIKEDASLMRDRVRDLANNGEIVTSALDKIENSIVGVGIIPTVVNKSNPEDPRLPELNALLEEYAASTDADSDGLLNLYGLQGLALRTVAESGEAFVVREKRDGDVPFSIRIYNADYVPYDIEDTDEDRNIKMGIECDDFGRRVRYWFYPCHPYDMEPGTYVDLMPIDVDDCAHVFLKHRPGQSRGFTWFAPIINKIKDLGEFNDSELMRQKIATLFSVFVTENASFQHPMFAGAEGASSSGSGDDEDDGVLGPGSIVRLNPGEDVRFGQPQGVSGYEAFVKTNLRSITSALPITYEQISNDYERVNFSSARMSNLEAGKGVTKVRDKMLYPMLLTPWSRWFFEAAQQKGYDTSGLSMAWVAPASAIIDPRVETDVAITKIRNGLSDPQTETAKLGRRYQDILDNLKTFKDEIDKRGLILDVDPSVVGQAGAKVMPNEGAIEVQKDASDQ